MTQLHLQSLCPTWCVPQAENILLGSFDGKRRHTAKLADFGLHVVSVGQPHIRDKSVAFSVNFPIWSAEISAWEGSSASCLKVMIVFSKISEGIETDWNTLNSSTWKLLNIRHDPILHDSSQIWWPKLHFSKENLIGLTTNSRQIVSPTRLETLNLKSGWIFTTGGYSHTPLMHSTHMLCSLAFACLRSINSLPMLKVNPEWPQ